jgi:hypothetical protein
MDKVITEFNVGVNPANPFIFLSNRKSQTENSRFEPPSVILIGALWLLKSQQNIIIAQLPKQSPETSLCCETLCAINGINEHRHKNHLLRLLSLKRLSRSITTHIATLAVMNATMRKSKT